MNFFNHVSIKIELSYQSCVLSGTLIYTFDDMAVHRRVTLKPGTHFAILYADRRDRRIKSPAFAKCARSRDFLRSLLRIASKANPSGWAILSQEFSKLPHRRDRRKKSPGVSASIGGDQIRRDRRIKSPGVSLALAFNSRTLQKKALA